MGSPLNLFLFYILISFTPLRQKSCILTDGRSVRNLQIDVLQFSRKLLNNFFPDTFAALRIVFKTSSKKLILVKSEIFAVTKYRTIVLKKSKNQYFFEKIWKKSRYFIFAHSRPLRNSLKASVQKKKKTKKNELVGKSMFFWIARKLLKIFCCYILTSYKFVKHTHLL